VIIIRFKAEIYALSSTDKLLEDAYFYIGYYETDLSEKELEDKLVDIATKFHRAWKHVDALHIFNEAIRLGYIKDTKIEEGDGYKNNCGKKYKVGIDPIPDPIMEWC